METSERKGPKRVLIVDDEAKYRQGMLDAVAAWVDARGLATPEVKIYAGSTDAWKGFQRAHEEGRPFDLVVSDEMVLGDMYGTDLLKKVRRIDDAVPFLLMTSAERRHLEEDLREGRAGFLAKPFTHETAGQALDETYFGAAVVLVAAEPSVADVLAKALKARFGTRVSVHALPDELALETACEQLPVALAMTDASFERVVDIVLYRVMHSGAPVIRFTADPPNADAAQDAVPTLRFPAASVSTPALNDLLAWIDQHLPPR